MPQKTKNEGNQGSNDKKKKFLVQSPSRLSRWVRLVQKTRANNSHAWAPLMRIQNTGISISSIPEEYHIFTAIEFCPPESN
jgi:hypothetical protein